MESSRDVSITVRLQHELYHTVSYSTITKSAVSGEVYISVPPNDGGGTYHVSTSINDGNAIGYSSQTITTPFGYCFPKC
jgi:hypothetical protein